MKTRHSLLLCILSLLVTGCSTKPKLPVPENNPPVAAVQENIATHKDQLVTWAGIILSTDTKKEQTEIIILSRRMTRSTRPVENDNQSQGRFIAVIDGFLDPAVYAANREITIHGTILREEKRKVGEFEYHYPLVSAHSHYLWPPRPEYDPRDDYWYDPWYGPWYYPYPYYPYHHHREIDSVRVPK